MAKGTLPRYAINLEEFCAMFPLKPDGSLKPDKSRQRSKGFYIQAENKKTYIETWDIDKDIAITGIKTSVSREEEFFKDNFDISVIYKGKKHELFSTVYIKDTDDYKNMVCFLKLKAGSKIVITYRNDSQTNKDVWFDIDYISKYRRIPATDPEINHDYDLKIVMRWEGNSSTDLDLHGKFSNGKSIAYYSKEIGEYYDKAWLDYDYTTHYEIDDREKKPEILTVLGAVSESVTIGIHGFRNATGLTEDVTLEIQKWNNVSTVTIKSYTISPAYFGDRKMLDICNINLVTGTITDCELS